MTQAARRSVLADPVRDVASADGKGVDHLSGCIGALVGIATEVGTSA